MKSRSVPSISFDSYFRRCSNSSDTICVIFAILALAMLALLNLRRCPESNHVEDDISGARIEEAGGTRDTRK